MISLRLMAASACVDEAQPLEDLRCQDPRIASVELDNGREGFADFPPVASDAQPAAEGLCDGSREIKLAAMDSLGPGALEDFYYLDRYRGAFFLIDGTCHYYALSYAAPRLKHGIVTAELLAQLTAELGLDSLAELPSSKDTQSIHFHDTLLATANHSLRCRDDQCRTPEATALIQQSSSWIRKLAMAGEASGGKLTAFALPRGALPPEAKDDPYYQRPVLPWPLSPTVRSLRQLVVSDRFSPPGGLEFTGDMASELRVLRSKAIAKLEDEPTSIAVSDCNQTYTLLLRDELPYQLHGDFVRFLEAAWKRPSIASCIPGLDEPEVSPCPDDFE